MTKHRDWILILGGSSGIGLATAHKLAGAGYHLIIVHRDRGSSMQKAKEAFEALRSHGSQLITLNGNIINPGFEEKMLQVIEEAQASGHIRLMLHSIAMGNLGSLLDGGDKTLSADDFRNTIDAMALSFLTIGKLLLKHGAFKKEASLIGLTSEGSTRVSEQYAAVGAAKSTLENLSRYMASEFMKHGVNVNIINSGVIDTAAISQIKERKQLLADRQSKNPAGRLTRAEDIANAIYLFTLPESRWINGSIIRVDGGEQLS